MENESKNDDKLWQEFEGRHKRGKVVGGILLVIIGALFLGRELGANIPHWTFSWKMLLIGLGLLVWAKHKFKSTKGLLLILIGSAFLICDLYPALALKPLLWPILVIFLGLVIIFKPRRKHSYMRERMYRRHNKRYGNWQKKDGEWIDTQPGEPMSDDRIEVTTCLGSVKKNVVSKNFKGGSIHNILGGSEINLSQADFEGTVVLEISNVLGGTQLIVPANWEIQSELTSIMGGIEDSRPVQPNLQPDKTRIMILRGDVVLGGIEIKSY